MRREAGGVKRNATVQAIEYLHQNDIWVVGGLIVGNPGDTRESIEANLDFARQYVDWPYIQHPTPYPGTPMTRDFEERGLDRQPGDGGVRRDDRGGPERTSFSRRNRVPAMESGTLDETEAFPQGVLARFSLRSWSRERRCSLTHFGAATGNRSSALRMRGKFSRGTRRFGRRRGSICRTPPKEMAPSYRAAHERERCYVPASAALASGLGSTGRPACCQASQPPVKALAFFQPAALSSRATRALVASCFQVQ